MLEAIAAMVVVLGIGFLMAHALDAFRVPDRGSVNPTPLGGLGPGHFAA
jgi:hypothetical protein